jgi:hypothetical protein
MFTQLIDVRANPSFWLNKSCNLELSSRVPVPSTLLDGNLDNFHVMYDMTSIGWVTTSNTALQASFAMVGMTFLNTSTLRFTFTSSPGFLSQTAITTTAESFTL